MQSRQSSSENLEEHTSFVDRLKHADFDGVLEIIKKRYADMTPNQKKDSLDAEEQEALTYLVMNDQHYYLSLMFYRLEGLLLLQYLILAIENDKENTVKLIIRYAENWSFPINASYKGETALSCAVKSGNAKIVAILLDHKDIQINYIDLNFQDQNGESPLFHAVKSSKEYVVDRLIKHGVNLKLINKHGVHAITFALENLHFYFKEKTKKALFLFIKDGIVKVIDLLNETQQNWYLNSPKEETKDSALFLAIKYNLKDVCSELISKGASVNIINDAGFTPLMMAVTQGNYEVVSMLLSNGALLTIDLQEPESGNTALLITCKRIAKTDDKRKYKYLLIASKLIQCGADLEIKNKKGEQAYAILPPQYRDDLLVYAPVKQGEQVNKYIQQLADLCDNIQPNPKQASSVDSNIPNASELRSSKLQAMCTSQMAITARFFTTLQDNSLKIKNFDDMNEVVFNLALFYSAITPSKDAPHLVQFLLQLAANREHPIAKHILTSFKVDPVVEQLAEEDRESHYLGM